VGRRRADPFIRPGRAKARGLSYLLIPDPLNKSCLNQAKFMSCHGPNGRPVLFGHLYLAARSPRTAHRDISTFGSQRRILTASRAWPRAGHILTSHQRSNCEVQKAYWWHSRQHAPLRQRHSSAARTYSTTATRPVVLGMHGTARRSKEHVPLA
jgi:hypothetical protein